MRDLFHSPDTSQRKDLRPHQARALGMLRSELGQGFRRVVVSGPTGFGKTLVASRIAEGALAKGNRVIFTAPAISLIDQTVEAFENEGVTQIGVMQANHPRTDPDAPIQVASVQTLLKRRIPDADVVMVDECHIRAAAVEQMMDERPDGVFVGLSASPWAKGMGLRWQRMVVPVTIKELTRDDYLSQFRVLAPHIPDLTKVRTSRGEYVEADIESIMGEAKLVGSVVQTWLEKGENRPTLLFGVNRRHAKALHDAFARAGVGVAYVDAFTDTVERKIIEADFRAGRVKVACSVRTLATGIDWPVSCIIDAAPTKSDMLHVQKVGRGLRINPGTEDLLVLDHASNTLRLGTVDEIGYNALDCTPKGEAQSKPRPDRLPAACAGCGTLHTGVQCPYCGKERPPPREADYYEGELREIGGKVKAPTKEDKQRFWSMALWLDAQRGRNRKLALGLYKGKFGVWPRGLQDTPEPGDQAFMNYEKSRRIAYAKRKEAEASKEGHA